MRLIGLCVLLCSLVVYGGGIYFVLYHHFELPTLLTCMGTLSMLTLMDKSVEQEEWELLL